MSDHKEVAARLRDDFLARYPDTRRQAADLIEWQAARIAELEATAVRFEGINPLDPVSGAAQPMIPESWRYAFFKADRGLTFSFHDKGPFVAWDAVQARIAELEAATRWRPMSELPSYAKGRRAIIPVIGITSRGRAVAPVVRALNGLMYDEGGIERTLVGWLPIPHFEGPNP